MLPCEGLSFPRPFSQIHIPGRRFIWCTWEKPQLFPRPLWVCSPTASSHSSLPQPCSLTTLQHHSTDSHEQTGHAQGYQGFTWANYSNPGAKWQPALFSNKSRSTFSTQSLPVTSIIYWLYPAPSLTLCSSFNSLWVWAVWRLIIKSYKISKI